MRSWSESRISSTHFPIPLMAYLSFRGPLGPLAWLLLALTLVTPSLGALLDNGNTVPEYVTKYAPLVWLHSEDPFKPSDILEHIRHTSPLVDQKPISGLPGLNLDNLEVLNQYGKETALTANDDVTKEPSWIFGEAPDSSGRIHNSTACCVILVERSPGDIDAFYFYFYSYDRGGNISQVLEPINQIFDLTKEQEKMSFGDHVGDWENNMIRFRNGNPTGIYYSQHTSGKAYDWSSKDVTKENKRPIVYSAYGSHANYVNSGDHVHDYVLVDYCDAGQRWDPVLSAYFYHLDPDSFQLTRLFLPSDTSSAKTTNLTSFFYFEGRWGDIQYPDEDLRQQTVPYFKFKRFQTGPTGPRDKQLIRKGLSPDRRHKESWLEWGVGTYMFWYPCCIKGWRIWVSGIFMLGIVVMVALGVRYGIRRYKRRGYKQVETEILLHDMGDRDSIDSLDRY